MRAHQGIDSPLVLFRKPGELVNLLSGGEAMPYTKISQALRQADNGFVFAPFSLSEACPILLYKPGYRTEIELKDLNPKILIKNGEINNKTKPPTSQAHDHKFDVGTSESVYMDSFASVISSLRRGEVEKVVLSRTTYAEVLPQEQTVPLFAALCDQYPAAFVYLASFPGYNTWLGASPEILLEGSAGKYHTMALAGTRKAKTQEPWGVKEQEEHAFVSRYIQEVLGRFSVKSMQIDAAETIQSGAIEHLCTHFHFQTESTYIPLLVEALHPTPAVCGIPLEASKKLIQQVESHPRAYYTGLLGPVQGSGNISLYVNLRCLQLTANHTIIYSGGGITIDSDPSAEWQETIDKAQTLLSVIEKIRTLAR